MKTALYLIPVTMGETKISQVLPDYNREIISSLKYFIVENVRTARRFLKKVDSKIIIDELHFVELNEHTDKNTIAEMLAPLAQGNSIGVMSEAGCPAIADPGADVVAIAQQKGFTIIPLVGPSSILLALMASGFNGQSFAFHGYLPIEASKRTERIKALEAKIYTENQTQIFIETPYRNNKLADELVNICRKSTKLCIATNITCEDEFIKTLTIKDWEKKIPDLNKKPTIFLIYK